jgi:acetyl esterase/lipase
VFGNGSARLVIAALSDASGQDRETYVYKVEAGCEIKVDVFGAAAGEARPGVVWIHGGGLIFGSRATPRPVFLGALLRAGIVVVSIDHRLAPETKLPEIVDDVRAYSGEVDR